MKSSKKGEGIVRVGVSFEPELLESFDSHILKKGYTNRSEAIRDLIRKEMNRGYVDREDEMVVGTLTILYDHDYSDLTHKLTHIQHGHPGLVSSTTHVHVDKHKCLEVLVVRGKAGEVRAMCDRITALKGVRHGELVLARTSL